MSERIRLFCCVVSAFAVGCGSSQPQPEYPPTTETTTQATVETSAAPDPIPPPPPPVQVVAGTNSPIEGAPPTLRVTAPRSGATIRSGDVMIRATLTNWALSPDGNHVHLILDNEPYIAVRDLSHPLNLNQLVQQNLGHELAAGSHVVRMFPSRGHHESVKVGQSFAMFTFVYRTPTADFHFDAHAPLLTYSRPKGCNVLGTPVLLDFYLANVTLAAGGAHVHYSIDSTVNGDINDWVPHNIENLATGDHTIELSLIGADGQPVAGPFNDTTRTISVQASCPAPGAAAPAPAATPAPETTGGAATPPAAAASPAPAATPSH